MKNSQDLILDEVIYIFIIYHIPYSLLYINHTQPTIPLFTPLTNTRNVSFLNLFKVANIHIINPADTVKPICLPVCSFIPPSVHLFTCLFVCVKHFTTAVCMYLLTFGEFLTHYHYENLEKPTLFSLKTFTKF